ncbi:MAG: hemolysin family protein [Dermatophilaceae bacterium]
MSQSTALWLSLLLLVGNAYFVGAEFAAMAARRSTLEPRAEAGSAPARVCLQALEQMGSMLATAQLGITVCSVGLGALAETALHELVYPLVEHLPLSTVWADAISVAVALLVVVYLHVVLGEMLPKNVAIAAPDRAALLLVPTLLYLARALRPLVRVMEWVAKGLVRMLGVEPKDEIGSAFTAQEVAHIVAESHREGLIGEVRQGLVHNAIEFSDRTAADVAVPVEALVCVSAGVTPQDVEQLVARRGFSRYPYLDPQGQPVGYVHLKDVLYADDDRSTRPIPGKRVRSLATVSPGDEIEDVLASMQRSGAHLARVVDASGQATGVVFLEDVIEVLVGEVSDATQR